MADLHWISESEHSYFAEGALGRHGVAQLLVEHPGGVAGWDWQVWDAGQAGSCRATAWQAARRRPRSAHPGRWRSSRVSSRRWRRGMGHGTARTGLRDPDPCY